MNGTTSMPKSVLRFVLDKVRLVLVSENNLHCSCSKNWFRSLCLITYLANRLIPGKSILGPISISIQACAKDLYKIVIKWVLTSLVLFITDARAVIPIITQAICQYTGWTMETDQIIFQVQFKKLYYTCNFFLLFHQ